MQPLLHRAGSLSWLPLQDVPRHQLALLLDHRFHGGLAECTDQLVLQVGLAGEEAQLLEARTVRDRAVANLLESTAEVAFLGCVVQSRETWPPARGPQVLEEATHVGGAAQVHDLDHLLLEVPPLARGQGKQGGPVAGSLDEDEGSR